MEQRIDVFSAEETVHIERRRGWVRDHYDEEARDKYQSVQGKLRLLDTIVRSDWIEPHETWKLQSLGITFGDLLAQMLNLEWVMVEDDNGRDPALRVPGTSILVYPLTVISKRIERGETVDVPELLREFANGIERLRQDPEVD
jgi:hypothetical protein